MGLLSSFFNERLQAAGFKLQAWKSHELLAASYEPFYPARKTLPNNVSQLAANHSQL
jgi:hypothetical protein